MKKIALLVTMMALLPWMASAQSPGDDIYYVPKKQKEEKNTETTVEAKSAGEVLGNAQQVNVGNSIGTIIVRDYTGRERDIDEYNRREFVAEKNDFSIENDTLYIDEYPDSDLPGHWVNGEFEGSPEDYEYAVRLIRFRNPAYAIPVSSPLYWDVVYGSALFPSWYWNVYDDGFYVYVFPTFSNPLWWNWRYDPWSSWYWNWNRWYWGTSYYYAWGGYWGSPYWGWHHHHHAYYPHYRPGGYMSYTDSRRGHSFSRNAWRGAASRPSTTSGRVTAGNTRSGRVNANALSDRQRSNNVLRSSATGRVVRPSMSTNSNTRGNSSYMRPTTNRPQSLDYTRPSSTRQNSTINAETTTRSVETRSSSGRSSFNRSSFGSSSRSRVNTGGGSSRSRR